MVSEIIEFSLAGEHDVVTALLCQLAKCLHQVALDHGSWDSAQLLWISEDVLGRDVFGGDEEEMEVVQQFQKAKKELMTKVQVGRREEEETEGGGDANAGGGGKPGAERTARKEKAGEKDEE